MPAKLKPPLPPPPPIDCARMPFEPSLFGQDVVERGDGDGAGRRCRRRRSRRPKGLSSQGRRPLPRNCPRSRHCRRRRRSTAPRCRWRSGRWSRSSRWCSRAHCRHCCSRRRRPPTAAAALAADVALIARVAEAKAPASEKPPLPPPPPIDWASTPLALSPVVSRVPNQPTVTTFRIAAAAAQIRRPSGAAEYRCRAEDADEKPPLPPPPPIDCARSRSTDTPEV